MKHLDLLQIHVLQFTKFLEPLGIYTTMFTIIKSLSLSVITVIITVIMNHSNDYYYKLLLLLLLLLLP